MSILKQLATEQINFNMNGYEDVIEVSEEEFTERTSDLPSSGPHNPAAQIIGIISLTVLDRGPQRPVKLLVRSGKLGNDGDMHGRTGPPAQGLEAHRPSYCMMPKRV
eukprot:Em0001g1795a